jgi:uncharacterized phiE125 gp8 family phage protein
MTTKVLTPPTEMPVTLEEAKLALREDGSEKDALIRTWIMGVAQYAEHYTGRAFITRPVRVTLDSFPVGERGGSGAIFLDLLPAASVESIQFYDANDALQTLDPQDYVIDLVSEPGCIVPARGKGWPVTADRINAVMCDFTAGYGADSTAIPEGVKLYVVAKVAEEFDKAAMGRKDPVGPSFVDRLLDQYKVYA